MKQVLITVAGVSFVSSPFNDADTYKLVEQARLSAPNALVTTREAAGHVDTLVGTTKHSLMTTPAGKVRASNFRALSAKNLVERADEILSALKDLYDTPAKAALMVQNSLIARDMEFDRWEKVAWEMARVELMDRLAIDENNDFLPVDNGGF